MIIMSLKSESDSDQFKLILILHAESSVNLESDILLRQFKNSDPSNWVKHETIK